MQGKTGEKKSANGAVMLQIDLKAGRYEIVQFITMKCLPFGDVRSIRIFLDSSPTAVIEMSTMEQTEAVVSKLEGKLVGATAFIDLAQRYY